MSKEEKYEHLWRYFIADLVNCIDKEETKKQEDNEYYGMTYTSSTLQKIVNNAILMERNQILD